MIDSLELVRSNEKNQNMTISEKDVEKFAPAIKNSNLHQGRLYSPCIYWDTIKCKLFTFFILLFRNFEGDSICYDFGYALL